MRKWGVIILCIVVTAVFSCSRAQEDYATVTFFVGDVKKNKADVEIGSIIKKDDVIVTGLQSSCDLKIGDSIIRIKEKSNVIISQLFKQGKLESVTLGLDVGKMLCKPKKLMKTESFLVKTPTAVAGVRGTQFTVESDLKKTTRIKVYNGKVQVIKRVPKLEDKIDAILEQAPAVEEKEKIVVTEKDLQKAEKRVDTILKEQASKGLEISLVKVVDSVKDDVVVSRKEIAKFKVEDMQKDAQEMITVEEKPKDVMKKIARIVNQEREKPRPDGRLLVTRYEIYFIKNGKVIWEGKVINPPLRQDNRLYVASGDYVFCASVEGPVIWRKQIENDGKVELKDDKLVVYSKGAMRTLDPVNGQE